MCPPIRFLPGFKSVEPPCLPSRYAAIDPAGHPLQKLLPPPVECEEIARVGKTASPGFVAALIGQVIAVPAAVVVCSRCPVENPDPPAAVDAISAQSLRKNCILADSLIGTLSRSRMAPKALPRNFPYGSIPLPTDFGPCWRSQKTALPSFGPLFQPSTIANAAWARRATARIRL